MSLGSSSDPSTPESYSRERNHVFCPAEDTLATSPAPPLCRRHLGRVPGRHVQLPASRRRAQGYRSTLSLSEPPLRLRDRGGLLAALLLLYARGTLGLGRGAPSPAARLRRAAQKPGLADRAPPRQAGMPGTATDGRFLLLGAGQGAPPGSAGHANVRPLSAR